MRRAFPLVDRGGAVWLYLLCVLAAGQGAWGQISTEQAAAKVLGSGRNAYREKKYDLAAEQFREYIKRFQGGYGVYSAHYGLGLCLLEAPQRDYKALAAAFQKAAGWSSLPERAYALYYLGVAQRGLAREALAAADKAADVNQAKKLRTTATQQFEQAWQSFSASADHFLARVKGPPAAGEELPEDVRWAARARCDQCEMLLRAGRVTDADRVATEMLADRLLGKSSYRALAAYYRGYAKFRQKDYLAAGKALSLTAPFDQDFGLHARYLLGRTHQLSKERPEAAAQYQALLADYAERKKAARELLKDPRAIDAERRVVLAELAADPPPDYVLRASFYAALLLCEQGRLPQALKGFAALVEGHPRSPLAQEARLRQGYCLLSLRNYPEAIKTLQPLLTHERLGVQATWWTARAQVRGANKADAQAYRQALTAAMATLRQAADQAARTAKTDPRGRQWRGDIVMELADTQQLAGQYAEAAATYQQAVRDGGGSYRTEEAYQRQATALHLAGDWRRSDEACQRFRQSFPNSTLLPGVLFRSAENAYMTAVAGAKDPKLASNPDQVRQRFVTAIGRYEDLLKRYPDFAHAATARYGLATAHYRLGHWPEAIEILSAIPAAQRVKELTGVSYLLADCLLRTLPEEGEQALQVARFVAQMRKVANLLESFVGASGKSPEAADAMIKLGHCYQRIAAKLSDRQRRQQTLHQARLLYERLMKEFPQHPSLPTAIFERAKCLAAYGDPGGAINELRKLLADPYRTAPIAPLALVHLANLYRRHNRPDEAAKIVAPFRAQNEGVLLKDPARAAWAAMLRYEHGMALKQLNKPAEAKAIFDSVAKDFAGRPEAVNAVWRAGQCRRQELTAGLDAARKAAAQAGAKPEQIAAAEKAIDAALIDLRQTMAPLQAAGENLGRTSPGSDGHVRMLYEVAWCYRVMGDAEAEAARKKLQRQAAAKVAEALAKQNAAAPAAPVPAVPISAVPVQPAEMAAREHYRRLIAAAPASALAVQGRFELAEMLARRGADARGVEAAIGLLTDGLAAGAPAALGEQMRLQLAAMCLARKDANSAAAHVRAIGKRTVGPYTRGFARYLAGEAMFQQGQWDKVIEQLLPFRDDPQYRGTPYATERALIRLGQAYAEKQQWDDSRKTYQTLRERHRHGQWQAEAHYGVGWALQKQGLADEAIRSYLEVLKRTVSETAAKAQLQIGLCHLAQNRSDEAVKALLLVPYTYDFPALSAAARHEAAQVYIRMKQPAEAAGLWRQVVKDLPGSQWARAAKDGLRRIEEGG